MANKSSKKKSKPTAPPRDKVKRRRVLFSLDAPEANEVVLVGDFNKWDPRSHPMRKEANGVWNKTLIISPGRYEYKFLVDGNWVEDPDNDQLSQNSYGTRNNVLNLLEA